MESTAHLSRLGTPCALGAAALIALGLLAAATQCAEAKRRGRATGDCAAASIDHANTLAPRAQTFGDALWSDRVLALVCAVRH
jgi:hypothetical protein